MKLNALKPATSGVENFGSCLSTHQIGPDSRRKCQARKSRPSPTLRLSIVPPVKAVNGWPHGAH